MKENQLKKTIFKGLATFFAISTFFFGNPHPIHSEVTRMDWNKLVFEKAGGFEDTGARILTLNNKRIKLLSGVYISRDSQKEGSRTYTVSDKIALPIGNPPSDNSEYNVMIGNFKKHYIRLNGNSIEAVVSENTGHNPATLYIQDKEGPAWLGEIANSSSTDPVLAVVPADNGGGNITARVGVGGVINPSETLYVSGNLKLEDVVLNGKIGESSMDVGNTRGKGSNTAWTEIGSTSFNTPYVKHGAILIGSCAFGYYDDANKKGSVKIELYESGNPTLIAESAEISYFFELIKNEEAPFGVSLGVSGLGPDKTYTAKLMAKNFNFRNYDFGKVLSAIALPIDLVSGTYKPPTLPVIPTKEALALDLSFEEGNYLTKNKIAFKNGGRIVSAGNDLFVVDENAEFYQFQAGGIDADEIHQKKILTYIKANNSKYDFIVGDTSKLKFGLHWDTANSSMTASKNIQTTDSGTPSLLVIKSPVNFLNNGLVIDKAITINKPKLDPDEPSILLDVAGNILVTKDTEGSMFFAEIKQPTDDSNVTLNKTENTIGTLSFKLPSGTRFRCFVFATVSIRYDADDKAFIYLEGAGATKGNTRVGYQYEADDGTSRRNNPLNNFITQCVLDLGGGSEYSINLKHKDGGQIARRQIEGGYRIMVIGIPIL